MSITGIYVECNRQAAAPSDCGEFVLTGQPAWVEHVGGDGTTQNAVPTLAGRVPYQPEVKFTLRITAFASAYVLVGPEAYTPGLGNGVWMRAGDVLTYSAQPGDRVSWTATGEVLPPVFTIGAQGLYSGRSAYDSEAPGFVYLSTNGDAGATTTLAMLFFRVGAVSGTWSDGVVFQGPAGAAGPAGPTGPQGPAGADGVSAVYSNATPQALGTASAGVAAAASRADHVHAVPTKSAIGLGNVDNLATSITTTGLASVTVPAEVLEIRTCGYAAAGDGGGAKLARDAAGTITSADGAKWRIVDPVGIPEVWGAGTGQASATNAAAVAAAAAASLGNIIAPTSSAVDIGAVEPDYAVSGIGKITANGIAAAGGFLPYNPARESLIVAPSTYQREVQGIVYPPPRGSAYVGSSYKTVISPGSKIGDTSKQLRFITAFGFINGANADTWSYVDALGGDAMAYAYRASRTVAVGSETLAWFGAPDQTYLQTWRHDWYRRPSDNPYLPSEVGWDGNGLETKFPGVRARISGFSAFATSEVDAAYTTAVGRDAGCHIVKGVRNLFAGYQAGVHMFSGSYNVLLGCLSGQNAVFADAVTAVGDQAGRDALDSSNATFIGYGAGRTVQASPQAVIIGDRAADTVTSAVSAVVIGPQAGASDPSSLDNALVIANAASTTRAPLISGSFTGQKAGINVPVGSHRAVWHARAAASGSALTPDAGVLVEGSSLASITVETNSSGYGKVNFADDGSTTAGSIEYSHSSDTMTFKTGATARWRMEATTWRPWVDNSYSLGTASYRCSTIYAGTGTINTSDANDKDWRGALSDAERAVAMRLARGVGIYRWKDAVAKKGDAARLHAGWTAQSVAEAFRAEGLDPSRYALWCEDEILEEVQQVVMVARPVTRTVERIVPEYELRDGVAVRVDRIVAETEAVFDDVPVVDAAGRPVTTIGGPVMGVDGNPLVGLEKQTVQTVRMPRTEMVEEIQTILVPSGRQRQGLRYDQVVAFILANSSKEKA